MLNPLTGLYKQYCLASIAAIFEKKGKVVKPVILFKSKTIKESKEFQDKFIKDMATLASEKLSKIEANAKDEFLIKIFKYLASNKISLDNFIIELKEDFSVEKTISVNSKDESEENQLAVNILKDPNNEYRAIFAVDKLNEDGICLIFLILFVCMILGMPKIIPRTNYYQRISINWMRSAILSI